MLIIVMEIYLMEYSDIYLKKSGRLWQNYRDEPALKDNGNIIYFSNDDNNNILFIFKQQIIEQTGKSDTKDEEIMVSLEYLRNF